MFFHGCGFLFLTLLLHFKQYEMQDGQQQEQQLNIELTEEMSDGVYSNLVIITHSFAEFVFDFVNVMPNVPKAKVKSIVCTANRNPVSESSRSCKIYYKNIMLLRLCRQS